MKERLVIKNFGPIQEVDLELGKMTVLIGDQATGKTTIAKVLAVCRYFSFLYDNNSFIDGLDAWGLGESIKSDSYISYECKHYYAVFDCSVSAETIGVDLNSDRYNQSEVIKTASEEFKRLIDLYTAYHDFDTGRGPIVPPSFYIDNVSKVMNNPFYLGTERELQSIFSLGKGSMSNISDYLFNQFAKIDQIARRFNSETEIKPLDVFYRNVNGQGFIKKKGEEKYYSMYFGASGYKAAIPIVLAMKNYNEIEKRGKTFIVEEPEISLFPEKQKNLVEHLVESIEKYNNQIIVNTHSPYIISSLNNLLVAYRIGQIKPELVEKIVPKSLWLNPDQQESNDVRAYRLHYDETKKGVVSSSLMDENLQEIKMNYLDGVSSSINRIWDQLIELEDEN